MTTPKVKQSIITSLVISCILCSCSPSYFKCNDTILERFQKSSLAEEGEYVGKFEMAFSSGLVENAHWEISEQGKDGCRFDYGWTDNGVKIDGLSYYLDLEQNLLYPNDDDAQEMFGMNNRTPEPLPE